MTNQLEQAAIAAATVGGAPPQVFEAGPQASIRLAEGTGHLLDGAVVTHWTVD